MNILIVITKGEVGGAQIFVSTLAKNLHRQGHKVTVAYGEGDYLRDTLAPEGIALVRFHWLRRTTNLLSNIRFGRELRAYLATRHPFQQFKCALRRTSRALDALTCKNHIHAPWPFGRRSKLRRIEHRKTRISSII